METGALIALALVLLAVSQSRRRRETIVEALRAKNGAVLALLGCAAAIAVGVVAVLLGA